MLFDDSVGFITFNFDNYDHHSDNLVNVDEGFLKGNMFASEYKPYKNYSYCTIKTYDKKEELLLEIMSLSFAINDLNLYLDLHPDNKNINSIFNDYCKKLCEKELEYINMYGPLELEQTSKDKFNWINSPWPWNNERGAKYV